MKIYICKYNDEVFLSDIPIQSDGRELVSIGFPCFRFNLTKGEELEGSMVQLLQNFGIKNNGYYKMELRNWPQ